MPIYEYYCKKCNKTFEKIACISERDNVLCGCGRSPKVLISKQGKDWFRPFWNEHLDPKGPVYIESKKQYAQECKKRGVTARCLL